MNGLTDYFKAQQLASMDPEDRAVYQAQQNKQARTQGAVSGIAGIYDTISGNIGQRQAEGDIERFGAEADAIRDQMRDMKAPSIMSPENQAAAVRNATILGAGKPQEDSSELAAAKMAMDAGADPANIQRALTEAEAQKDATARAEQQGAFREGLGYAHQDAMSGYQKDMQDLGMDYDENQRALEMAQNQSLMAQQQKQQGFGNLAAGATKFLSSGGVDAIGNLFGGGDGGSNAQMSYGGEGNIGGFLDDLKSLPAANSYEDGGAVQATPGAFNHDNGDGVFQTGENEILGFAQTANGLEDTGIRMTGGEFVINPDQAEGMEKAYDRIKRKKDPSRADLMALYEAVRFLDEPQFD
tara:strand:+ start:11379 stop:12443 length:1065 start_codon:yes stop_codon:yes gene_type:complete